MREVDQEVERIHLRHHLFYFHIHIVVHYRKIVDRIAVVRTAVDRIVLLRKVDNSVDTSEDSVVLCWWKVY